jgi:hypothetical protein
LRSVEIELSDVITTHFFECKEFAGNPRRALPGSCQKHNIFCKLQLQKGYARRKAQRKWRPLTTAFFMSTLVATERKRGISLTKQLEPRGTRRKIVSESKANFLAGISPRSNEPGTTNSQRPCRFHLSFF